MRNEQAIGYGTLKKQSAATLAAIAKRQQERNERKGLGGILSRMSGAARRDSERAELERATLASIEARENEQNGALTARQHAEKASLSGQHGQQINQFERRIEHARDRRERESWQPHREIRREAILTSLATRNSKLFSSRRVCAQPSIYDRLPGSHA